MTTVVSAGCAPGNAATAVPVQEALVEEVSGMVIATSVVLAVVAILVEVPALKTMEEPVVEVVAPTTLEALRSTSQVFKLEIGSLLSPENNNQHLDVELRNISYPVI